MDGALPFLILILVLGASVGFAIGISALVSRWERTVPKPGMSAFMDISRELAPGLNPSNVFVLESTSTTFTRSWCIRDVHADTDIARGPAEAVEQQVGFVVGGAASAQARLRQAQFDQAWETSLTDPDLRSFLL